MDDGNTARACEVAQAAVLQRLLKQDDADAALLGSLSDIQLSNWNGIDVGRLQATQALRAGHIL